MKILDLFCGAGGASMGYYRAGFTIVGVDIKPQPNYPFRFHQADAMTYPLTGFDAIHASPPCQHFSTATAWMGDRDDHPDLLRPMLERLRAINTPWIVENVPPTKLLLPNLRLCGTSFGLRVIRHRVFGMNWGSWQNQTPPCNHTHYLSFDHGLTASESSYRDALGVKWMTIKESREAIPPVYTQYIGSLLKGHLKSKQRIHG